MPDAGIGRVLVASLHQGISDVLPTRLGFYEEWLNAEGLRGGTIGVGPVTAVLSFLRQEGDAYGTITSRAGEYAAEWTVDSMSPFQRSMITGAPEWFRARLLLRVARRLVTDCYQASRALSRVRKGIARVDLEGSIFCSVRDRFEHPLCGFYAAMYTRLFALFHLEMPATVVACRAKGESACVLTIPLLAAQESTSSATIGS